MTLQSNIAKSVRQWRELRGLTQAQLAAAASMSEDAITRIESTAEIAPRPRGTAAATRSRAPSVGAIERIAAALDVPPGVLTGGGWLELLEHLPAPKLDREPGGSWRASCAHGSGRKVERGPLPEVAILALYKAVDAVRSIPEK